MRQRSEYTISNGENAGAAFGYPSRVTKAQTGRILDGAALAISLRERLSATVAAEPGRRPFLRVLLVGTHPASESYVTSKTTAARACGIDAETRRLDVGIGQEELLAEVAAANADASVDGILVQLPLPAHHDARRVLDAIDPLKDVDGFHPENVGLLQQGRPRFVPCTPAGVLALLDAYGVAIARQRAVVIGRSDIVGKPAAALLTQRDATVTICHSRTRDLAAVCREADILVAAIGRPGFVTREFVRDGAAVVDVGINRLEASDPLPEGLRRSERIRKTLEKKGRALVGDVDFDDVAPVAGWISPVPGGVGPLTVARLLENTHLARRLRAE
jgi:methylenetetrahydrofolate dehydrogenase (NADP+)/methenyltetrahydrofolate cyclohydrolase